MKLRFSDRQYNSISIEKTASYYRWRLLHDVGKPDIHVLIQDDAGEIEVMHAGYLRQSWYRRRPPLVIGLAKSYEEAMAVAIALTCVELKCNLPGKGC